jgi:uncharacterized protein
LSSSTSSVARYGKAAQGCAAFFLVFLMAITVLSAMADAKFRRESLTLLTSAGERKIDIEVAETMEEKSLGLMFRTALPDTQGMLFPYTPAQEISMWMKNTFIPLDMVFIKADGTVHRIEVRTEPMSEKIITSQGEVTAVLELAGGAAARLGLQAGDRVTHGHFAPKK